MLDKSTIAIYDYVYNLLFGVVTENVYLMFEPEELLDTDVQDGFVVVSVGDVHDESEFNSQAYGWARVFVEAYVPTKSRGRLDETKYAAFENGINEVIEQATEQDKGAYFIVEDSVVSSSRKEQNNMNNQFMVFMKSFIVNIDKE